MFAPTEANHTDNSQPQKRPLFNRPKWAGSKNDAEKDLFHRSRHAYDYTAGEDEALRKSDRRSTNNAISITTSKGCQDSAISTAAKPRSALIAKSSSSSADEADEPRSQPPSPPHSVGNSPIHRRAELVDVPNLVQTYTNEIRNLSNKRKHSPSQAAVIDLEDATTETRSAKVAVNSHSGPTPIHAAQSAVDTDISIDEDFPELARKAREDARKKRLQQDFLSSTQRDGAREQDVGLLGQRKGDLQNTSGPTTDFTVSILVTSKIEGTKPLIVARKLSQRLKDVRLAWTQCQSVSIDTLDRCFLTWRGRRIFDSTSCRGLGLSVDEDGVLRSLSDQQSFADGQIHVEVMTPEIFEAHKKVKEQFALKTVQDDDVFVSQTKSPQMDDPQIRIVLKAKDLTDLKLRVKPSTPISKIVGAFRQSNHIASEKDVFLSFDGERLQADLIVKDTEITDMDHIEVYIR